ncbi:MAG: class I SAM-dependent methyltransferase [Verrucomicrobiota bacterium]
MSEPSAPRPQRLSLRFLRALANVSFAKQLAMLTLDGYLAETGWTRSVRERRVVDAKGEPLPWVTYPFIDFLVPRLRREWRVFEYGAGSSTLFYAHRVASVTTVEHDEAFASDLQPRLPPNVRLWLRPLGSPGYIDAVAGLGFAPEMVIVDGRNRVRCANAAVRWLAPGGVLVFDDMERPQYAPADALLRKAGFRRLDFWGISPGYLARRCTSLFYRPDNVLGL